MPIGFLTTGMIQSKVLEYDPLNNESFNPDPIDMARLFSMVIEPRFRFNCDADTWFFYDGIRWVKDAGNMSLERIAQEFQKVMLAYCLERVSDNPKKRNDKEAGLYKVVTRLADRTSRTKLMKDAAAYRSITYSSMDRDENLLNCTNGTLNLKTLELKPHDPKDMLTMVTRCEYQEGTSYESWMKFMDEIMQGNTDKIRYLQKIAGLCLTCDMSLEQSFILLGTSTRNGKSAFLETLGYMMGDYSCTASPSMLEDREKNSAAPSPDLAALAGKRLVRVSEPRKRMQFNSSMFKQITGGEEMTARFLHENNFQFKPVCKIVFNTNFLPVISDDSVFASDRLKVITFDRHFNEEEQYHTLKDKLRQPYSMSGILNWCIEGLRLYHSEGLKAPSIVDSATEDYRSDQDKIKNFFSDVMEKDMAGNVSLKNAYRCYVMWCKDNGYGVDSKQSFKADLQTRGLLMKTGTIQGRTIHNVIPNYVISKPFGDEHDL